MDRNLHSQRKNSYIGRALSLASAGLMTAVFASGIPALAGPTSQDSTPPPATSAAGDMYASQIQPIFKSQCYKCHAGMFHRGGLKVDTPENILKGGRDGAILVPGHPEQSMLIRLIRHEGPPENPMPMPPHSKLSDADIATVTKWIQEGAIMPGPSGQSGSQPASQPPPSSR